MSAKSVAAAREQMPIPSAEQVAIHMLTLVTEIMVDDVTLAEQVRTAIMTIWLAEKRTHDPRFSWIAWRDIVRGEEELRRQLFRALRRGYLHPARFDQAMSLITSSAQHRLSCFQPSTLPS